MINQENMRVRRFSLLAMLVALALGVSACGGDDETSSGGSGSGSAEKPSGPAELKFGVLTALTGELASFGQPWQQGVELAVQQMNDSGAMPEGWKATATAADERDAEAGLQAALKMINSDKVSAIVGPTSGVMPALHDAAHDNETPIISPAAGTVSLDKLGGEYLFRTVSSDSTQGYAVTRWYKSQGVDEIAMLVQNDEATTSPAAVLEKRFEENGGKVVASVTYNPGQSSYQAELQKVLDADPEMIFLAGGQESGVTVLKEAFQAGYDGTFLLTSEATVQEVIDAAGRERMEGVEGMTPKANTETPEYQAFAKAFEKEYGEEPELFTANAYDAAVMVGLAAVAAGSTEGAGIAENLREVSSGGTPVTTFADGAKALAAGEDIDYVGASGPVDFDETGSVDDSYAILEVKGGKWKEIEFYSQEEIAEERAGS